MPVATDDRESGAAGVSLFALLQCGIKEELGIAHEAHERKCRIRIIATWLVFDQNSHFQKSCGPAISDLCSPMPLARFVVFKSVVLRAGGLDHSRNEFSHFGF